MECFYSLPHLHFIHVTKTRTKSTKQHRKRQGTENIWSTQSQHEIGIKKEWTKTQQIKRNPKQLVSYLWREIICSIEDKTRLKMTIIIWSKNVMLTNMSLALKY